MQKKKTKKKQTVPGLGSGRGDFSEALCHMGATVPTSFVAQSFIQTLLCLFY